MRIPPAQLWIGDPTNLANQVKEYLQEIFCKKNDCKTCGTCKQIAEEKHHGSIWLKPEKFYTLDNLAVIFKTITLQLDPHQKLFFIIQNADFLTEASSNSLLKSVEEPPEGYHFIFLAERLGRILPTIQSRCTTKTFNVKSQNEKNKQLRKIFEASTLCSPANFLKILDEEKPNEKETIEILDKLLNHWIKKSKEAITKNNRKDYKVARNKVATLKYAIESSPMPGSSKIFWRNLYLQFS